MKLRNVMLGTLVATGFSMMTLTIPTVISNVAVTQAAVVQNLKQTEAYTTSVTFSGSYIYSTEDYKAYYSTDNGMNWTETMAYSSKDGEIVVSGLKEGTHYDIKISSSEGQSNIVKAVTALEDSTITAEQLSATTNTATISWGKVEGADGYEIKADNVVLGRTTNTTYEITSGLNKENSTYIKIYPYIETTDYCAITTYVNGDVSVYLKPDKPTTVLNSWYKYAKEMQIDIDTPYYYEDYEVCFYNAKGKEIQSGSEEWLKNASMNSVYSAKSRTYVTIAGQKVYSEWSDKMYAVAQPTVNVRMVTTKKKVRNLKLSWTKIKGVDGYDIYVSASGKSNFKKVASVSSGKKSYTVKKIAGKKIAKNKTQYVYVVARKKIGDQTMKSAHVYCYSVGGETYTEQN